MRWGPGAGGARGVTRHLAPADLVAATGVQVVDITIRGPAEPARETPAAEG